MIRVKHALTVALAMASGISDGANGAAKPEFEQRILATKLISSQTEIRSNLDESEKSLVSLRNELSALVKEAPTLDAFRIESWTRRCNSIRNLSDYQLAKLANIKMELSDQATA